MMPVRCNDHAGNMLVAPWLSDEAWEDLRLRRRDAGLRFTCCEAPVGMRVSKSGLKHFYHLVKGDCEGASESEEHLHVKMLLAEVARDAGWEVRIEEAGRTPDGGAWRADVLAQKGGVTVAMEAQFSPQEQAAYVARTKAYAESGIRVCWFVGGKALKAASGLIGERQDLPAVGLLGDIEAGFSVALHEHARGGLPLAQFAAELVRGQWKIARPVSVPAAVVMVPKTCPACGLLFGHQRTVACYPGDLDPKFGPAPVFISPYATSWIGDRHVASAIGIEGLCRSAAEIHGLPVTYKAGNQNTPCPGCGADVLWRDWTLDQLEHEWTDLDARHGTVQINFWGGERWHRTGSATPKPACGYDGERVGPLWLGQAGPKRTLGEWFEHIKTVPQKEYQKHLRFMEVQKYGMFGQRRRRA